jgi:hypothetical protein
MAGRLSEAGQSRKRGGRMRPAERVLYSAGGAEVAELADAQDLGTVLATFAPKRTEP